MYLDSVVVSGLIIVAATCAVLYYVGRYAYRHFKADVASHPEDVKKQGQ